MSNHLDASSHSQTAPAPKTAAQDALSVAKRTVALERRGLKILEEGLDEQFVAACELLAGCQGRVVVTGMGKSGLIGRKIAATLSSTGTPAFFMHPGEAAHGDLGMLVKGDVLLAISNSGESDEIKTLLPAVAHLQIPLVSISRTDKGSLAQVADVALTLGAIEEACPLGLAPTTSTTATLVLGDALAVSLLEARNFTAEDFALSHPAGALGKRLLLKVGDVMHTGEEVAQVSIRASLQDALFEMTSKRLGMTAVVNDEQVVGIFTDGDLRRALSKLGSFSGVQIGDVMTKNPISISSGLMAADALTMLNERAINQLLVIDNGKLVGIITLHMLLKSGLSI